MTTFIECQGGSGNTQRRFFSEKTGEAVHQTHGYECSGPWRVMCDLPVGGYLCVVQDGLSLQLTHIDVKKSAAGLTVGSSLELMSLKSMNGIDAFRVSDFLRLLGRLTMSVEQLRPIVKAYARETEYVAQVLWSLESDPRRTRIPERHEIEMAVARNARFLSQAPANTNAKQDESQPTGIVIRLNGAVMEQEKPAQSYHTVVSPELAQMLLANASAQMDASEQLAYASAQMDAAE